MTDQDRTDFEQVARDKLGCDDDQLQRSSMDDGYSLILTDCAWRAFQAGRRKREKEIEFLERRYEEVVADRDQRAKENCELRNQIASLEAEIDRLSDERDSYAALGLCALSRHVATPEKGYVKDGGPRQMAADIRRLGDARNTACADRLTRRINELEAEIEELRGESSSRDTDSLRGRFERWARENDEYFSDGFIVHKNPDGTYADEESYVAWQAVQAFASKVPEYDGDLRERFERWIKRTQGFTDDDLTRDNDGPYDRADVDEFWQAVQAFAGCGVDVDDDTPITAEALERLGLENHRPTGCGFAARIVGRLGEIVIGTMVTSESNDWRWVRSGAAAGDTRPIKTIGDVRRLAFGIDAQLTERAAADEPVVEWREDVLDCNRNTYHICFVGETARATLVPVLRYNVTYWQSRSASVPFGDVCDRDFETAKSEVERLIHEGAAT